MLLLERLRSLLPPLAPCSKREYKSVLVEYMNRQTGHTKPTVDCEALGSVKKRKSRAKTRTVELLHSEHRSVVIQAAKEQKNVRVAKISASIFSHVFFVCGLFLYFFGVRASVFHRSQGREVRQSLATRIATRSHQTALPHCDSGPARYQW